MPKNEVYSHLLAALFYSALITILGNHFRPEFMIFWVGTAFGTLLIYLDPLISTYLSSPKSPVLEETRLELKQKKFQKLFWDLVSHHQTLQNPLLHSGLFQFVLALLSFFVVTSTANFFGAGMVMGMSLHLIKDEVTLRHSPEKLKKILFWNIHREISPKEQMTFLAAVFTLFGLETLLLF